MGVGTVELKKTKGEGGERQAWGHEQEPGRECASYCCNLLSTSYPLVGASQFLQKKRTWRRAEDDFGKYSFKQRAQ